MYGTISYSDYLSKAVIHEQLTVPQLLKNSLPFMENEGRGFIAALKELIHWSVSSAR
jgi:hypothetical protein